MWCRATKGVHTRAERPISVAAHLLGLFERFCKQNEASRLNDDDLGDLFATLVVLPHVRCIQLIGLAVRV